MPKAHRCFFVQPNLPAGLAELGELAYNLHWSWDQDSLAVFRRLDQDLWEETHHNPARLLGLIRQDRFAELARDDAFVAEVRQAARNLREYLAASTWFGRTHGATESPKIAYFSMEFGLTECLPIYSGGLGILAGDHLKSASDLGVPMVAVGLLYQQGYFRQYLNADGWQQEMYPDNDFDTLPIQREFQADGSPLLIDIPFPGRMVRAAIWRAQVGRVALYLLDTNVPSNHGPDRKITDQLYGGDQETRIQQEIVLGIGGMKALRTLGIHVHVCHMNEGHAAFMALERIRHRMATDRLSLAEALEVVRAGTIFTTHTPVAAGIDVFEASLVRRYFSDFCDQNGIDMETFLSWGRQDPGNRAESFNMAQLALRTTSKANAVSRLHGETSRRLWRSNWPDATLNEVPIDHVTNGIHTRSWISAEMTDLLTRYLGPEWLENPADRTIWNKVQRIPDLELWRVHERRKDRLVAFTRNRLAEQQKRRNSSLAEVEAAFETLNPGALTIGFARRFATYKRANLLFRDTERLRRLLGDPARPVQFIFAGKAHPRDHGGKELIRGLIHAARSEDMRKHLVFLEDYDISVARYLVQGVDVWLNTPERPLEASGTSGMKVVPNGGLNLSILDGWWAEAFEPGLGWAIGAGEVYDSSEYRDDIESKALFGLLENEIVPKFYTVGADGIPRAWISMMKDSMMRLGPVFNTTRMVQEYSDRFYVPAHHAWRNLSVDDFSRTREMTRWMGWIRRHWPQVEILSGDAKRSTAPVGDRIEIEAEVFLGALQPTDVEVQIYAGPIDSDGNVERGRILPMEPEASLGGGRHRYAGAIPCEESGRFGFLVRLVPRHEGMNGSFAREYIRWLDPLDGLAAAA